MKDFFKKHPELLFLLIGVIVVDCVIMWMWFGDTSVTEESRKKIEQLRSQATKINESKYAITNENAAKAQVESEKWAESLVKVYDLEAGKYSLSTLYEKGMIGAKSKKILKDKVIELIEDSLGEKNKTPNKLSFGEYDGDKLFLLKPEEVERVFEFLSATEELVNMCVEADIVSLDSIERPNALTYVDDNTLKLRNYTFKMKVTASAEGVKRLMNLISANEKYYFEINGFSLAADEQIAVSNDDIRPNVQRLASAQKKDTGLGGELAALGADLGGLGGAEEPAANIQKDSVAPFVDAVIHVDLTVDWVQFLGGIK